MGNIIQNELTKRTHKTNLYCLAASCSFSVLSAVSEMTLPRSSNALIVWWWGWRRWWRVEGGGWRAEGGGRTVLVVGSGGQRWAVAAYLAHRVVGPASPINVPFCAQVLLLLFLRPAAAQTAHRRMLTIR